MKKNKITAIIISAAMIATMAGSMITNSKANRNIAPQIKYTALLSNATNSGNWINSNGSWYYNDLNGSHQTGWQKINSSWYYFNSNGVMQTGWQQVNGDWYYLNSNGSMQTGWQGSNGNWYYLNSSGAMQTGWQKINNTWYYLNSNGSMQTGLQNINGSSYYLNSNGAMQTGWQEINNAWYDFNSNGAMQTGWQGSNGNWYYLNSNGIMQTGWQQVNGDWYYLGSNGAMQTGWQGSNGSWYYLNSNGTMQTGWQNLSGTHYYLNSNGAMQTGWLNLSGNRYYLNANGAMQTGNAIINGTPYTFNSNGVLEVIKINKLATVNSPVGLWLLQSPSMQGKTISLMPFNSTVTIIKTQGLWTQVNDNGTIGWCYNQYLTNVPDSVVNPNAPQAKHKDNVKTLSIKGLDISNYQGNVNFAPVKKAGYDTAIIEAGCGVNYPSVSTLNSQYEAAKSAKMNIGFYYFFNPNVNIQQQAENFWSDIKGKNFDVYPVLDVETPGSSQDITDQVLAFMKAFKSLSGLNCIIYTNYNFANNNLDSRLANYKCWIADYGVPSVPSNSTWNSKDYVGWQYTGSGKISGLTNSLDLDKFNSGIYINPNIPYVVNTATNGNSFAVESTNLSLANALGVTKNSINNSQATTSTPSVFVIK